MKSANDNVPAPLLLKLRDVERITSMGRSSIYRNMAAGIFPRPVALGSGSVRWRADSIDAWVSGLQAAVLSTAA